jgi:hypothetical protein
MWAIAHIAEEKQAVIVVLEAMRGALHDYTPNPSR